MEISLGKQMMGSKELPETPAFIHNLSGQEASFIRMLPGDTSITLKFPLSPEIVSSYSAVTSSKGMVYKTFPCCVMVAITE